MVALVCFIILAIIILILIELRERKQKETEHPSAPDRATADSSNQPLETKLAHENGSAQRANSRRSIPADCCGEHLVCERETLLNTKPEIVYYDDEELDALAGIAPDHYTPQQQQQIEDIFYSLQETDVAGWCRSLQLRGIELPPHLREQALLIVREQRQRN